MPATPLRGAALSGKSSVSAAEVLVLLAVLDVGAASVKVLHDCSLSLSEKLELFFSFPRAEPIKGESPAVVVTMGGPAEGQGTFRCGGSWSSMVD